MTGAILLLICLILIGLSIRSFQNGLRRAQTERVLGRLAEGQPQLTEEAGQWSGVEKMFLRAGLGKPTDSLGLWLTMWGLGVVLGGLVAGWVGLLVMLVLPLLLLRLYIAWRYQRRIKRMIEQLPQLLDHTVRSLKAGRTLADAVLGGIEITEDPLQEAMGRIRRNVQLGVSLPESAHDFAEFYERDEFRLFALGLKVNHRYGGNASELLEKPDQDDPRARAGRSPATRPDRRNPGDRLCAHRPADLDDRLLPGGEPRLPDDHVERRHRAHAVVRGADHAAVGLLHLVAHVAERMRWLFRC